jgi:hypothetical protein
MSRKPMTVAEKNFREFCKDAREAKFISDTRYKQFMHAFKNVCNEVSNNVNVDINFFDYRFTDDNTKVTFKKDYLPNERKSSKPSRLKVEYQSHLDAVVIDLKPATSQNGVCNKRLIFGFDGSGVQIAIQYLFPSNTERKVWTTQHLNAWQASLMLIGGYVI